MPKFVRLVDTAEFVKNPFLKKFYPLVRPLIDRVLGFHQISKYYQIFRTKGATDALSFCSVGLEHFNITVNVDRSIRKALTDRTKPTIILANHPYGCIDALALMKTLEEEAPGKWRFLANKILKKIKELQGKVITVDPFAEGENRRNNLQPMREMLQQLKQGGIICMFPARRVSEHNDQLNQVCDLSWSSQPFVLAKKFDADVLLIHIDGQNSQHFLNIPPEKLLRRSLRLAKEIPLQVNKSIKLTLSSQMTPSQVQRISKFANAPEILRAHTYIGADKTPAKPKREIQPSDDSDQTESTTDFLKILNQTLSPIAEQGGFVSFCFQGNELPEVLEEIGRLREITFQHIGAGSGNTIDLSEEDHYYRHIVVVDSSNHQIAGAYRVGFTQDIIADKGAGGVYLDHIFDFKPEFYQQIGNAMELSRSFISPFYQKSPAILDLLWKSLGAVAKAQKCTKLYGSVTISAQFTPLSQAVIVNTLDRFHGADPALRNLVSSTHPFIAETQYHQLLADAYQEHGIGRLNGAIEEIEEAQRGIPPLIRYYTSLGAKFLSFKVEPTFNNAIYCLLVVDLESMPRRYKKRFL